jgi:hypothetical protein
MAWVTTILVAFREGFVVCVRRRLTNTVRSEFTEVDRAAQQSRCSTPGSTAGSAYDLTLDEAEAPPSSSQPQASQPPKVSQEPDTLSGVSAPAKESPELLDSETDEEALPFVKLPRVPRGFQCDRVGGDARPTMLANKHVIEQVGCSIFDMLHL